MLFKEIIGQEEVKAKLIRSVNEQRISHAQLFFGPEGVGKLALAIAYAQYINCHDKQKDDSCGVCPSCVKFNKMIHPDLHFMFPVAKTRDFTKDPSCFDNYFITGFREAVLENPYLNLEQWYEHIGFENKQGIINADDCGEIIKRFSLKSYESEYKMVIVWMAEKIYYSAAPKLLKILEEPPPKTLFILIADNPDMIIKTIISRTQLVKVPRIEDKPLHTYLVDVKGINPEEATKMIHQSEGSISAIQQILQKDVQEDIQIDSLAKWLRLCYKSDFVGILEWIEGITKIGREKQKTFLSYTLDIIQGCVHLNWFDHEKIKLSREEYDFVANFAKVINDRNSIKINEELNRAAFHIERNANPKILFLDLSIKMGNLLRS